MNKGTYLQVNKPEYYTNQEFLTWLNSNIPKFTWHTKGKPPSDYSDVILYYEEEADSFGDLPLAIADELYDLCKPYCRCLVWITNLK